MLSTVRKLRTRSMNDAESSQPSPQDNQAASLIQMMKGIRIMNGMNIGCIIMILVLLLTSVVPTIFGIVKSFQSFWVTGIIVTLLQPAPFIVGMCEIFGYPLADKITALYHK